MGLEKSIEVVCRELKGKGDFDLIEARIVHVLRFRGTEGGEEKECRYEVCESGRVLARAERRIEPDRL